MHTAEHVVIDRNEIGCNMPIEMNPYIISQQCISDFSKSFTKDSVAVRGTILSTKTG
jgi:hypothetical protein